MGGGSPFVKKILLPLVKNNHKKGLNTIQDEPFWGCSRMGVVKLVTVFEMKVMTSLFLAMASQKYLIT